MIITQKVLIETLENNLEESSEGVGTDIQYIKKYNLQIF